MTETNDHTAPEDSAPEASTPEDSAPDASAPEDPSTGEVRAELGAEPVEDDAVSESAGLHPDAVGPPNLAAALNVPAITQRD